jgi:hypothetical protein
MRTAIAGGFGTNQWNADAHQALSETYSISAALENHAIAFATVYLVWKLEGKLRPLADNIGVVKQTPQPVPTKAQVEDALQGLRQLYRTLGEMCDKFTETSDRNFLCRVLVRGKIDSIRECNERLLDLADAVELSLDPDLDKKYFDKAIGELDRGETHSLEEIF